jgi:hypothetical protein
MRNIALLSEVWAFTNWGLKKGIIVEISNRVIRDDDMGYQDVPEQYKLDLYIDRMQIIQYDFYFTGEQLFDTEREAIDSLSSREG